MHSVDGFVRAVPKNLNAYVRLAKKAGRIWREHGALEYREWVGDNLTVKMGLPFPPRQNQVRRDGGVFMAPVQITIASRPRERQWD